MFFLFFSPQFCIVVASYQTDFDLIDNTFVHLSMKQGSLFCFVLSSWDLLNCSTSCHSLGIFRKLWWVGVHWLGLRLIGAMVWKLLLVEPFSQWKLNRIETKNCIEILGTFLVFSESPREVRFNRFYFTIFRAKMWKILICEWILLLKIQTNYKNCVGKEKSVEPSMCSHLGQHH